MQKNVNRETPTHQVHIVTTSPYVMLIRGYNEMDGQMKVLRRYVMPTLTVSVQTEVCKLRQNNAARLVQQKERNIAQHSCDHMA